MISQYSIRKTLRDALKSFDIERNIEEVNCVDARERKECDQLFLK
jgi:hypothetical protein